VARSCTVACSCRRRRGRRRSGRGDGELHMRDKRAEQSAKDVSAIGGHDASSTAYPSENTPSKKGWATLNARAGELATKRRWHMTKSVDETAFNSLGRSKPLPPRCPYAEPPKPAAERRVSHAYGFCHSSR
jgi:hypothetical protein